VIRRKTLQNILSAASNQLTHMAFPGHRQLRGTKAAGPRWPAAFLALSLSCAWPCLAFANLVLETGVAVSTKATPFLGLHYTAAPEWQDWTSTMVFDARMEPDSPMGDASAKMEWHAETRTPVLSLLELDSLYEYVRERDGDIEQYHDLGFDIGGKHDFGDWALKADAGVFLRLHQDTTREDLPALDRREEDFTESDLAMRGLLFDDAPIHPFVELAYVRRDYLINTGRDFAGFDAIVGMEFATTSLTGEAGLFTAWRDGSGTSPAFVAGPTVELKWTPRDNVSVLLDLTTGLEQKTTGSRKIYRFYEAELTLRHQLNDSLNVSASVTASWDRLPTGDEIEIEPVAKLEWAARNGVTTYLSGGAVYNATEDERATLSPTATVGLKVNL
jgi:Putative beta-barrel porin 2